MHKHYVTFYSPGTFIDEVSETSIPEWNTRLAVSWAETIVERHGAKPFGFRFTTVLTAPAVEVKNTQLKVEEKVIKTSGMHFLGGRIETLDEVKARNYPAEHILCSNMRNNWPIVIVNERSYKTVRPFEERDVIIDAQGRITTRGDDADRIAYRKSVLGR